MLFQWFDYETLEKYKILSRLTTKCQQLVEATNSTQKLAEVLRIDRNEAELEREQGDTIQSEAQYLTIPGYQAWGFLVLATYLKTIYPCGSS
jgi:hypothetical protein